MGASHIGLGPVGAGLDEANDWALRGLAGGESGRGEARPVGGSRDLGLHWRSPRVSS